MIGLINILNDTVNNHVPLIKLSREQMKIRLKPWLTPAVITFINTKNKLLNLCYKQNKINLVIKYKKYWKLLKHIIKHAKQSYYQMEIAKHKK